MSNEDGLKNKKENGRLFMQVKKEAPYTRRDHGKLATRMRPLLLLYYRTLQLTGGAGLFTFPR